MSVVFEEIEASSSMGAIVRLTSGLVAAHQITFDRECPHAPCDKKTLSGIEFASSTASSRRPIVAFKPDSMLRRRRINERRGLVFNSGEEKLKHDIAEPVILTSSIHH